MTGWGGAQWVMAIYFVLRAMWVIVETYPKGPYSWEFRFYVPSIALVLLLWWGGFWS